MTTTSEEPARPGAAAGPAAEPPADGPPVTAAPPAGDAAATAPDDPATPPEDPGTPWERLDARMIWVDALRVLLSMTPAAVALLIVRVEPTPGVLWPLAGVAAWGTLGAVLDVVRWLTTRYRVTGEYVERRTGLLVRTNRSVRRDRVRSVDADARLLQRLVGLRRVKVGAGQMNTAMESALVLDAVSKQAALALHDRLLGGGADQTERAAARTEQADDERVFAGLRWWWVFYNMFNVWAFLTAAGLLWGAWVTLGMFGVDSTGWVTSLADWESLGTPATVGVALAVTWLLGAAGLGVNFFTEHAHFRLMRIEGEKGTLLRTTQGLFKTREINRDDNRLRGAAISEPLLWRWMRMADTTVITTGLSMWSVGATILPRGPRRVARNVVARVLGADPSPLEAPLRRHPAAALRRRIGWALTVTASVTALLAWTAATTKLPHTFWWISGPALLAVSLALAAVGHRSLGHTFTGDYVVVRSGAVSRATSALQLRAVSGVRVRQSLFQRRLGLATVSLSTAAGLGGYQAVDLAAEEAAEFADRALPGGIAAFRAERGDG
ncbi:PH domain-containing protein [Streptomyces otsuchiensis]|uniref:PH domain-containing protein n=1 Tax=Streptomyces otsuchiensis TaxID=2681388 RepID=UPI0010302A00|nr:PH domain-containing protein [Streptomyces otsuchiensis]